MHLKRFRSTNVRDALRAVREELGPKALVLSTTMVQATGWRGLMGSREVEITAAAEREASVERPAPSADRQPPAIDGITAQLLASGLDRQLAEEIAASIPGTKRRAATPARLRDALAHRLSELAAVDEAYARVEVFIGPPGAGKTTTIAKIAAQERLSHNRALNLVSADAFRAGAIEQLRSYAEIMAVPFRVARTPAELDHALTAARNPVLVDTAGRSPGDDSVTGLIRVLEQRRRVRTHLVLAADTSASTANRLMDRFSPFRPSRVVITKLDETDSVMPLLAAVRERGLAVSYLSAGQRVAEDLWRATPSGLAATLLREPAMEEQPCH